MPFMLISGASTCAEHAEKNESCRYGSRPVLLKGRRKELATAPSSFEAGT